MYEGTIVGLPVQTPWVDVRSIGAGGGSIAYVDVGGLLRVGPRSAGADPGPACYGRGGTRADRHRRRARCSGMLGDGALASGDQARRRRCASRDRAARRAARLRRRRTSRAGSSRSPPRTMANAIREITVEQGQDPRDARRSSPFGGAGPLFGDAARARARDRRRSSSRRYAGNFSAWGLLGADLTQTPARTRIMTLADGAVVEARTTSSPSLFDELAARAAASNGARGRHARGRSSTCATSARSTR